MISFIEGKLESKKVNKIVVNSSGIGYEIFVPLSTYNMLPEREKNVRIYTHVVKREDEEIIYGFISEKERDIFRIIISIQGIGPKIALSILSFFNASELSKVILNKDTTTLSKCPGIGKKTAERIIFELKDKLDIHEFVVRKEESKIYSDALDGLIALGYKVFEARKALEEAKKNLKEVKTAE
ncbi:MAG: Holliday junction branch migration protein RuvA, partial [Caldiserica bacterium]